MNYHVCPELVVECKWLLTHCAMETLFAMGTPVLTANPIVKIIITKFITTLPKNTILKKATKNRLSCIKHAYLRRTFDWKLLPQSWQPKGFTTSDIFVKIPGLFHLEETNKYLVELLTRKRYACLLVHIFFSKIFGRKCNLIFFLSFAHSCFYITVCVVRIKFGSAIGPRHQPVFDAWWQLFWGSFCRLHLPVLSLSGKIKKGSFRCLINRLNASLVTKAIFFHRPFHNWKCSRD